MLGFRCVLIIFRRTLVSSVYATDPVLIRQKMETPLDVLSRAASLVQPDTRESKLECIWSLFGKINRFNSWSKIVFAGISRIGIWRIV